MVASQHLPAPATDCWNQTGIYGDGTCAELAQNVHCRNCGIHSAAGLRLLNRPISEDYVRYWTERVAQPARLRNLPATSAVPFRACSEWLALPTGCLQEVTHRRPIHSVPHAQPILLGLANVRGELLLCISLGHLLGLSNIPPRNLLRAGYRRLLVVAWNGCRAAFPVDEVQGPHRFYPENIKPAPGALARSNPACVESVLQWQQRTLVLLDPDLLLSALNRSLT